MSIGKQIAFQVRHETSSFTEDTKIKVFKTIKNTLSFILVYDRWYTTK